MPKPVKKKKKFIRKRDSTTYRLIPGYVPDNDELKETPEEIEARKEEQRKVGVFYNDNYNYMQHLTSVTEGAVLVNVSQTVDDAASEMASTVRSFRPYGAPSEVASSVRSFRTSQGFFSTDVLEEAPIDAEVLAALEDAPEVKVDENDLEKGGAQGGMEEFLADDFMEQAGGVDDIPEENEEESCDSDQDLGSDEDIGSDFDDDDFDVEEEDDKPHPSRGTVQDDIIEAQTALILRNFKEGFGFTCSTQISNEDEMEPTPEDYENLKTILKQDKLNENPMTWSEVLDDHSDRPEVDTSKYLYEDNEEFEWKEVPPSKPKFDCVSILSLNSNTRNLPTDIIPPKAQKSRQTSVGDSVHSGAPGLSLGQIEEETRESHRADRASTYRPKDETVDEKKMRKKAIKEERKDRRQEKKANRIVFSNENVKLQKETASLSKSGRGVQIS